MRNKGITLIALVITIIILLILASVTVATLMGENGIITKARVAKEETEKAAIEEQVRLAQLSAKIKINGGAITIDDLLKELEGQGIEARVEDGSLIIGEDYSCQIEEDENGDVTLGEVDSVTDPAPTLSIEVKKTDNTITVTATTKMQGGGSLTCYVKEENVEYQEIGNSRIASNDKVQETFNYTIGTGKRCTMVKVEATAANGKTTIKEAPITNIDTSGPEIKEPLTTVRTTSNSITVSMRVQDTESGLRKIVWYYKNNNAPEGTEYSTLETSYLNASGKGDTTEREITKILEGLTTGTYDIYAEIYDVAGNKTTSDHITPAPETELLPEGKDNIQMDYQIQPKDSDIEITYDTANWTNGNVKVTLTNNSGNSSYRIQYKKNGEGDWTEYKEPVPLENNGDFIVAQLVDKTGNVGTSVTGNVMKIDRVAPSIQEPKISIVTEGTGLVELKDAESKVQDSYQFIRSEGYASIWDKLYVERFSSW